MPHDLSGHVAVVTGGARGLGYSIASAFAASGAAVALVDVLDEVHTSARTLADETGARTFATTADVTDSRSVDAAFDAVAEALGTPDILLTAAGITIWGDSVDVPAETWRKVLAVDLDGTFFSAQAFARRLLSEERAGTAILVGSMSGQIINVPQRQSSYSAAKAGVHQLAKSLGVEWARDGIRVNAIAPGYFLSDMTKQFTEANPELAEQWIDDIPMGRMGRPEDLHGLVTFLASDESAYITAQTLVIDGGYTAL